MAAASQNGEKSTKMTGNDANNKVSSFGLPKLFSMIEINLENSLLSEDRLNNPPSLADGMHVDIERDLRYLGCELIQTASILLKLPQVAAATGQILFHRFYYSKSFVRYNFEHTAMACINLASKIEESPRRIRDVINVFNHMRQINRNKRSVPMLVDQKYVLIKNEVIKAERRVLKELGFGVHVKHPHKLIVSYLKALNAENETLVLQKAWNYMNDGLRTDIFLRYTPETIACACIFLSARFCDYPLPCTTTDLKWWELFDADETSILDVCKILLKMYARKHKPNWEKLEDQWNKLRIRLQETQAANKITAGVENTPNPHGAAGVAPSERFSPPQSRQPSPKSSEQNKAKRNDAANGTYASPSADRQKGTNQTNLTSSGRKDKRRQRSSSAESGRSMNDVEGPSDNKHQNKYLPKRYLANSSQQHRSSRIDDRLDYHHHHRKEISGRIRDEKRTRAVAAAASRSPSPQRRKKQRKRSRSSSRIRREQEKREREVRQAIGKNSKKLPTSRHR